MLVLILLLGIYPRIIYETTDPAVVQVADRACISAADGDEEIAVGCVRPDTVTLAQEAEVETDQAEESADEDVDADHGDEE